MNTTSQADIIAHYENCWANRAVVRRCDNGPFWELPSSFCVLEFSRTNSRKMWTYATCGMSKSGQSGLLELHLFSPVQFEPHVELLTAVAHYHCTGRPLALGHTVNFGRPWMPDSKCDHGLISLPYLDGPSLEEFRRAGDGNLVRCLWLVPITSAERDFVRAHGVEALERKFDEAKLNYLDPLRQSVV